MNIVTANCHTLVKFTKLFNAVVESLLVVRLVVVSIPHGGLTELFFVLASVLRLVKQRLCMCYSVCGIVHIKVPLLLIEESSPCSGGNRFPLPI